MNAVRRSFKELKAILEKVPILESLTARGKYIFAIGCFAWIIDGLIPDTAHFAVTLFSSTGRIAIFIGLFFTLVRGDEDRFIMITSTIISVGALIIIIVELAAASYLASFESYLFLLLFCTLAVNTAKYKKNKRWYVEDEEDARLMPFTDILSHPSDESESPIQVETLSRKAPLAQPEASAQPMASHEQSETPLQKTSPAQPESPEQPMNETAQTETPAAPKRTAKSDLLKVQRAPSVGAAPSVKRAPRVRLKPKE